MPRPRKCRKVCSRPGCAEFAPAGGCEDTPVLMGVDEYEVIRLVDHLGLTQEQCADKMEVGRTTVQAIYATARKKLAACIVEGRRLQIGGGDIRFCEHRNNHCGHGCCRREADAAPEKD